MGNGNRRRTPRNSDKPTTLMVSGGYFDYQSLFLIIVIVLFGVMMVYSSSSYRAVLSGESSIYFAIRQAGFAVVGIVGMILVSKIDYRWYKEISLLAMIFATILLIAVFFIGTASHGRTRWIPLGPIQFQPSEVAKPALIVYMSHICIVQSKRLDTIKGIFHLCCFPLFCIGLIAVENLSTAIVCFAIMVVIMFVASPRFWNLLLLGAIGIGLAAIFVLTVGYRGDRFDAWLHPETSDTGFQTMQSLYAIGSGGLFGRGLGQSIQKLGFLPESHNDMIFSVICEELGLFGALCVILLFAMLINRFRFIANHSRDSFGGLIVTGVITHVAVQLIVNIGVVTNTIPPTGVTLPFISYGGTSLVFMLLEIGLVLGVSRQMDIRERE